MKKGKRLKVGDTVTHSMIDRDGNTRTVKSCVVGTQSEPASLENVTAATKATRKKKAAAQPKEDEPASE